MKTGERVLLSDAKFENETTYVSGYCINEPRCVQISSKDVRKLEAAHPNDIGHAVMHHGMPLVEHLENIQLRHHHHTLH